MARLTQTAALLAATVLWLGCDAANPVSSPRSSTGSGGSVAPAPPPPPPQPAPTAASSPAPTPTVALPPPGSTFSPDDPIARLTPEQLGEQILKAIDRQAGIMATVSDAASSAPATAQAYAICQRRQRLEDRLEELVAKMSPEEKARQEAVYAAQRKEKLARLDTETVRMQKNRPIYDAYRGEWLRLDDVPPPGVARRDGPVYPWRVRTAGSFGFSASIVNRYGPDRVIGVVVQPRPEGREFFISKRLREIAEAKTGNSSVQGDTMLVTLGPVADVGRVAKLIDFGEVTRVDANERLLVLKPDPAKLPASAPPQVLDPDDPGFYQQNLADLEWIEPERVRHALDRLSRAEPRELREEIAAAVKPHLENEDATMRRTAVRAYAVWAAEDTIPVLIGALQDGESGVREEALTALASKKDDRAYAAMAKLLETQRADAVKYLRQAGAPAEKAVASQLSHADPEVRAEVVGLLGQIGTEETLPKLLAALKDNDDALRQKVLEVLTKRPTEGVIRAVAGLLTTERDRAKAADALQKIGPAVEDAVLKKMRDNAKDKDVVAACCSVLAQVGTRKSLTDLGRLIRHIDPAIRTAAEAANKAIQAKQKKPK